VGLGHERLDDVVAEDVGMLGLQRGGGDAHVEVLAALRGLRRGAHPQPVVVADDRSVVAVLAGVGDLVAHGPARLPACAAAQPSGFSAQ
jgi:hypothetical protein